MARAGCRSSMAEEHWTEIPKGIPRGLPMRPLEKAPGNSPPAPDFCPSFDGQFVKGFDKTIHARFEKAWGRRKHAGKVPFGLRRDCPVVVISYMRTCGRKRPSCVLRLRRKIPVRGRQLSRFRHDPG